MATFFNRTLLNNRESYWINIFKVIYLYCHLIILSLFFQTGKVQGNNNIDFIFFKGICILSWGVLICHRGFNCSPGSKFFLILTSLDVTMAANFSISSDSESEPSEEVEEGENNQSSTDQGQHVLPRHALTLPELKITGRKPEGNIGKAQYEEWRLRSGKLAILKCLIMVIRAEFPQSAPEVQSLLHFITAFMVI